MPAPRASAAKAPKGNATALRAESNNGGPGVYASSDSLSFALWAQNTSPSPNASTGIRGDALGAGDDIAGVLGKAFDSGINQAYGVKGVTDAAGSSTGATQPAGVRGEATNSSGVTHGVHGTNLANSANEFEAAAPAGVFGDTDTPNQQGVVGTNTASSGGSSYGVIGLTESPNAPAVLATNPAGGPAIKTSGDVTIDGSVFIGDLGASAEQTTDISIATTPTDVVYDNEVVDDRGEYDQSTGVFTCATPGDYHVQAQVFWEGTPSEGELVRLAIRLDGIAEMAASKRWPTSTSSGERITQDISKTMRNLAAGDQINITAQTGNTSHDIIGIGNRANLQISKIG